MWTVSWGAGMTVQGGRPNSSGAATPAAAPQDDDDIFGGVGASYELPEKRAGPGPWDFCSRSACSLNLAVCSLHVDCIQCYALQSYLGLCLCPFQCCCNDGGAGVRPGYIPAVY